MGKRRNSIKEEQGGIYIITTMNEIEQRFDAIKDHKPKSPKKLSELGEILSSAYKLNPDRADEMWQYLVELNVRENVNNAKFYIAQVFKKVRNLISAEDATDFIMMTPERVKLMLLYCYAGGGTLYSALYSVLNTLTVGFLKNENVNNVMASLEYIIEKFEGVESGNQEILKAAKTILRTCAELLQIDNDYASIVKDLLYEIENIDNEEVAAYGKVKGFLLGVLEEQNVEELLGLASDFGFTEEFLDLLWIGKRCLPTEKLEYMWQTFAENINENDKLPMPEEYGEEEKYSNSKMEFYVNLIAENDQLLTRYFENSKGMSFKQCIFYKWIKEDEWDKISEYIAKSLMAFDDQNNTFDGYMRMIGSFMHGYLMSEYIDEIDQWGRSIKIINNNNIEKFIDSLCKASAMSVGCEFHEQYHARIKEFVEKTTRNMSCFEKYGFSEKLDTRSGLERLQAFAHEFLLSGKKMGRGPSHELKTITDKIYAENRALVEPKDVEYVLACNDDIIEFYYKHTRECSKKGEMLAACIKHGDIERAIKIIELLKDTRTYDDYSDLNGWRDFGLTIEYCIKEFNKEFINRKFYSYKQDEITPSMIEECKQIANMCFIYLNEESVDRIKGEIRKICPDEAGAEEYIQKLLDDVNVYCTFPKPQGKGGAPNINRMSYEIGESFEILSKMDRVDIICQIMEQFEAVKDVLEPISYD